MSVMAELREAAQFVRKSTDLQPSVGLVLGSGLGAWADSLDDAVSIPYGEIPHMASSSVVGHKGNLVLGACGSVNVACLQGRVHLYEGHALDRVVFGVRLLCELGVNSVLLTNAAGGLIETWTPGTLMLISDHLNLTGRNPLVGPNIDELGPRFPDMTRAYDGRLRALAREAAHEVSVPLKEGVYAALLGPTYETPAEIAMLRTLGAQAVGMSTALEVIALRHRRVRCAAVSCITNLAAGLAPNELDHSEVEDTAKATEKRFGSLLTSWVRKIGEQNLPPASVAG